MIKPRLVNAIKAVSIAAVAALGLSLLTGCSAKAYPDQCALIVGSGAGDAHQVKKVFLPGEKVSKGDDQSYFLPCGDRNYEVQPNGDDPHTTALDSITKGDSNSPGIPVKIQLNLFFTLNENKDALKEFWADLCRKYQCASTKADNGDQSSTRFSTSGWLALLRENFTPALQRAAREATSDFGTDLWQQQGQANWPKLAQEISTKFMTEIKAPTNAKYNFFCATGSNFTKGQCSPVGVTIQSVQPADSSVKNIYNQGIAQDQQQTLNKKRVSQAKQLYGQYWAYFLGLQDTIAKCHGNAECIVSIGGGSAPAVTLPTTAAKK